MEKKWKMKHSELVNRAEKWLKNTFHCRVILTELVAYTKSGETPDAIGWINNKSVLVECKRTLSDFYADLRKRSRYSGMPALGHWRFYLTLPGVITVGVPEGWGLYEIHGKKIIYSQGIEYANGKKAPFISDRDSEVAMLLSALSRKMSF